MAVLGWGWRCHYCCLVCGAYMADESPVAGMDRPKSRLAPMFIAVGILVCVVLGLYVGSYLVLHKPIDFRGVRYRGFDKQWKAIVYRPLAGIESIVSGRPVETAVVHTASTNTLGSAPMPPPPPLAADPFANPREEPPQ
jgi:hypothetical protein